MSYDLQYLEKRGVSSGNYKSIFTADRLKPLQQKLVDTIHQRLQSGVESNLSAYRTYWAIDLAHETPVNQTAATLVSSLLSRSLSADDTLKELAAYGLSERDLFLSVDMGNGVIQKRLNAPVFYQIFIPLVCAYHTMRTARIYNQRDTSPLFKFKPAKQTDENRVMCDIITDIVDTTAQWYGWSEYLKTAIQQMLKYGVCLAFPKEEWHVEEQVIGGTRVVQKEGLRYDIPHPTRMGWDLHHPLPTINTDTGVEYAYHWNVVRYGDILDNRMYWNRKAITFGQNWMDKPLSRNYFSEVYPCRLKFPQLDNPGFKREDKAAYYSTAERDSALFLTEFFWKLTPSRWGLGDYRYPVWHRFTVASDSTILWAAPCAYNPIWFMGYDFDAQAGQPSSFSLECLPWQHQLGNILSQMVLTAKQNLESTVFYEQNIVKQKDIVAMENLGEKRYRSRQFLPFDSLKMARAGLDIKSAFMPMEMPWRSIAEMQSMISTELNIMERVLGITAQEAGVAGPHYQSKAEIDKIGGSSDNRINYTSSSVDAGIDAWMLQGWQANVAYRDDDVTAQITSEIKDLAKHLSAIGFEIKGEGSNRKLVGGKISKLAYVEFSRSNANPNEAGDPAISAVLFQTLQIISQKPEFVQAIGIPRILKLIEQGAKLAGAPHDFDITTVTDEAQGDPSAIMQQIMPILAKLQESIMLKVNETVTEPAAKALAEDEKRIQVLEETTKKFERIFALAEAAQQKTAIKAAEVQQQMQIDAARFVAEEQRKSQAHAAELERMSLSAEVEAQAEIAKVGIATQLEQAKADIAVAVQHQEAQSKVAANAAVTASKVAATEEISRVKVAAAKSAAKAVKRKKE